MDALTIDEGAVAAPEIGDAKPLCDARDTGLTARDTMIVDDDDALGRRAAEDDRLVAERDGHTGRPFARKEHDETRRIDVYAKDGVPDIVRYSRGNVHGPALRLRRMLTEIIEHR